MRRIKRGNYHKNEKNLNKLDNIILKLRKDIKSK